jgi:hypothetical protein
MAKARAKARAQGTREGDKDRLRETCRLTAGGGSGRFITAVMDESADIAGNRIINLSFVTPVAKRIIFPPRWLQSPDFGSFFSGRGEALHKAPRL